MSQLADATVDRAASRRRFRVVKRLVQDWTISASILFLIAVTIAALVPDLVAPLDPGEQSLGDRLNSPLEDSARGVHWLGTDSLGRDVLSRVIAGARISMMVAFSSVFIAGSFGLVLGLVSGFYGGIVDDAIGWLTDVQLSFPTILLAIAVVAVLGASLRNLILVLGVATWVVYGRIVRGEVLALRNREFIEAARVIGATDGRVLFQHILPSITTPFIIITTFEVARIIIAEAALSFLGLGAGGQSISWGMMMADGRKDLATSWWIITMPGIALMLTVLAINLVGDWLRDELDPRVVKS